MVIKNLTYKYKDNLIFDNVSITLGKGLYQLKGVSGSGKSTFFYLLKGIIPSIKHKYQVSLMCQEIFLQEDLTIYQNLKYVTKDIKRIDNLLEDFNLEGSKKIKCLSLGQKQIVSFIQTILKDADIYLFDEPCSNLDTLNARKIYKYLKDLSNKHCVIFSTHKPTKYGQILKIENQKIHQRKTKDNLIKHSKQKYKIDIHNLKFSLPLYFLFFLVFSLTSNILKNEKQTYQINDAQIEYISLYSSKEKKLYCYSLKGINNYFEGFIINDIASKKFSLKKYDYLYSESSKHLIVDIIEDDYIEPVIYVSKQGNVVKTVDMLKEVKSNIYELLNILKITIFLCFLLILLLIIEKNIKTYLNLDILYNPFSLKMSIFFEFFLTSLLLISNPYLSLINITFGFFSYFYIKKREIYLIRNNQ